MKSTEMIGAESDSKPNARYSIQVLVFTALAALSSYIGYFAAFIAQLPAFQAAIGSAGPFLALLLIIIMWGVNYYGIAAVTDLESRQPEFLVVLSALFALTTGFFLYAFLEIIPESVAYYFAAGVLIATSFGYGIKRILKL